MSLFRPGPLDVRPALLCIDRYGEEPGDRWLKPLTSDG